MPEESIQRASLKNYYNNVFLSEYIKRNSTVDIDVNKIVDELDPNTVALQYEFIVDNENPLGEKEKLDMGKNFTPYSVGHRDLHPEMRDFLQRFGYYDIFIVDADKGSVMYSVFKALDYGTSLIDGPYANSGLGIAFKAAKAIEKDDEQQVYMSDFSQYLPSYNAPAAFIATPIFAGTKKTGILIFQMPVGKINNIMAQNEQWEKNGLGKSGETFLVGTDNTMRSQSRILIENPERYNQLLAKSDIDKKLLNDIRAQKTSIGLHKLDNPAVNAALAGETGVIRYQKYHGKETLSSYAPIKVLNNNWALMSEIDYQEAVNAATSLSEKLTYTTIITASILIGASIFAAIIFARSIVSPITKTVDVMHNIAEGDGDLTARLDESRSDELGELAEWFNTFTEKVQSLIINIRKEADELESTASQMKNISSENAKGAIRQQQAINKVTDSMNEVKDSAENVAENAITAEKAANKVNEATINSANVMSRTKDSILHVADQVNQATETINELEATSETIGSVVGVINSIAEQTNLLALNAAIEAARAGEQGRGFAVVADEVRALASRTQQSTTEINQIIEKLQSNAEAAVEAMKAGNESVETSVTDAESATAALDMIKTEIGNITEINQHISHSAQTQNDTSQTAKALIVEVNGISDDNKTSAETVDRNSKTISQATEALGKLINQFKIQ